MNMFQALPALARTGKGEVRRGREDPRTAVRCTSAKIGTVHPATFHTIAPTPILAPQGRQGQQSPDLFQKTAAFNSYRVFLF